MGGAGHLMDCIMFLRRLREWPVRIARRALSAAMLGLGAWAGVGCVSAKPSTHTVAIRGFQYLPDSLAVRVGDTVRWVNDDIVQHTASVTGGDLDSKGIQSKQAWRFVAARTGEYRYACAFHPAMRGTLVVR